MLSRLQAIAVFLMIIATSVVPCAVYAEGFADNYAVTDPPKAVPSLLLQDHDGQTHNLQDFKGQFIVLNLWATWCGPCVEEMPSLDRLQRQLGSKTFVVLTLNEDHDGITAAEGFFRRHSITALTPYADPNGRAPSMVHARGLPTTLLINSDGMEIGRVSGQATWDSPAAITLLKSATAPVH